MYGKTICRRNTLQSTLLTNNIIVRSCNVNDFFSHVFSFRLFFPSRLTLCPHLSYFTHCTTRLLTYLTTFKTSISRRHSKLRDLTDRLVIIYIMKLIIGLAYTANIPRGKYVNYYRGRCHCTVIACRCLLVNRSISIYRLS